MAHTYREVRQTTVRDPDPDIVAPSVIHTGINMVARIISLIGGIIVALLGLRFILALLGANLANPFADFIYTLSRPFVAPFFGLFNYQPQFGVVRFEFETLIAMAFWSFVTWMIVRLITIADHE